MQLLKKFFIPSLIIHSLIRSSIYNQEPMLWARVITYSMYTYSCSEKHSPFDCAPLSTSLVFLKKFLVFITQQDMQSTGWNLVYFMINKNKRPIHTSDANPSKQTCEQTSTQIQKKMQASTQEIEIFHFLALAFGLIL